MREGGEGSAQSETALASPKPMMLCVSRLKNSKLLRVVDQI